jgi:hypothetical protein
MMQDRKTGRCAVQVFVACWVDETVEEVPLPPPPESPEPPPEGAPPPEPQVKRSVSRKGEVVIGRCQRGGCRC